MPLRNLSSEPPYKSALVDERRVITLGWLSWFNAIARLTKVLQLDAAYDPASVPAGSSIQASATVMGARVGDFVQVSFSLPNTSVLLSGQVTAADTVTVTLTNVSAGAIDLPAGTLRVRVEAPQ